ncbi:MAG: TIGR00282 family metallophosphoesterase [Erysipelotrichaceae bacterium]|nr:TIGR00282 family metallophosphoesterase [Erysipelotrichaceae bacterium]
MRILFIGDIVGKSGRDIVSSLLYSLKVEYNIDLVIANGENSAHGKGITYKIYNQLINDGVDYITMGNHTFSKKEIFDHIDEMDALIVPFNHEKRTCGKYYRFIDYNNIRFCLTNILGNALMGESNISMFDSMDQIIKETSNNNVDFYFVDLHAETTAEKRIFAEYYKDVAKVVVGTHTHVQTADERMINDVAFISDVGMCGTYDSVIGRDISESVNAMLTSQKSQYTIAEGDAIFCAVIIEIDDILKKPISIERLQFRPY